ncbi:DUF4417 domain-containing protein [Cruoricaptor ignavus]|uniref:DUF4417 domain-containing protein n=1 Tax=Cruoricaptor ignavus TaxID=1118202 RepID=UPI00370DA76D
MVQTTEIPITKLENNTGQIEGLPKNPRFIRNERFYALKKSIEDFAEGLEYRELIVVPHGKKYVVVGGNMRLRAMQELGFSTAPCKVSDLKGDAEKLRRLAIMDNISFGNDDWEALSTDWDETELKSFGMELAFMEEDEKGSYGDDEGVDDVEELNDEEEPEKVEWVPDCLFASDNVFDIPVLKMPKSDVYLHLPLKPYGADARTKTGVGTYHFYVDDYRFNAIWNNPEKIINSGCHAIVEPNCSLYETTPIGYGIFLIYKKRWIARMLQDFGIDVFVDLNVTEKFHEYNVMGVPEGYNAFFTRGYDNRISALEKELELAKKISGMERPNFCVYAGSKKVKDFCNKHSLTYVDNSKLDIKKKDE